MNSLFAIFSAITALLASGFWAFFRLHPYSKSDENNFGRRRFNHSNHESPVEV